MNDITRIRCPLCSSILRVKLVGDLSNKKLTCPTCKSSMLLDKFILLQTNERKERTEYNDINNVEPKKTRCEEHKSSKSILGKLKLGSCNMEFKLKDGRNIIGRQASSSSASIQIPTNNSLRMSREHLIINVQETAMGYQYVVSLYKENVNATFVNNELLEFGDSIILKDQDIIKLPDISITFEC